MRKNNILKNITLVGLLFGLAIHVCFYSNIIFENTNPSFDIIPEIFLLLILASIFGLTFNNIIERYMNNADKNRWRIIYKNSLSALLFFGFVLIILAIIDQMFGEYFQNNNLMLKIIILGFIIYFGFFIIFIESKKMLLDQTTS